MKPIQRLSIRLLKYAPVVGAFIMWVHVTCLLCGRDYPIADTIVSLPAVPCVTCIVWSKAFGFCPLHRCFIGYIGGMTHCIRWQADYAGFGLTLPTFRWMMFVIGIFLFAWFVLSKTKWIEGFAYE